MAAAAAPEAGSAPVLTGIHHVTAIAGDPQRNLDFYTGLLGLRLVKLTVNFDSPNVYHFYYGDGLGSPGTILTFFPYPNARQGRQGARQAAVTALAISPASLGYWIDRFLQHGVKYDGPKAQEGPRAITFRDPDGLALQLVADDAAVLQAPWERGPVPVEHQIRTIAGVEMWETDADPTTRFMIDTLGFVTQPTPDDEVTRLVSNGQYADVRATPGFWNGVGAAGTVHHVAWRTPDDVQQADWLAALDTEGVSPTPVQDRQYFHSIYFREPGGVLFEIATDSPGFAIDESLEDLGTALQLPPWFEPQREQIVDSLPPLLLPALKGERV